MRAVRAEQAVPLRAGAVYLAPSGRMCRWVPATDGRRHVTSYAVFEYLVQGAAPRHQEAAAWREGFHLTPANYRLLKEL